jgi:hypothetical protein
MVPFLVARVSFASFAELRGKALTAKNAKQAKTAKNQDLPSALLCLAQPSFTT